MRKMGMSNVGKAWFAVAIALLAVSVELTAGSSARLGAVKVTLESSQYYKGGDYTRFVYRVDVPAGTSCPYWILGLCDSAVNALWYTSPASDIVTAPLAGAKFDVSSPNGKFYLYLTGRWTLADTELGACVAKKPPCTFTAGWIDGPGCAGGSLAISVVSGGTVAFPPITGPGLFGALDSTALLVTSSTSGWTLSTSESYTIPQGGSEAVVGRIFETTVAPYTAAAGTTDIDVSYALRVAEADLSSLPQGTYEILITYTVTTN